VKKEIPFSEYRGGFLAFLPQLFLPKSLVSKWHHIRVHLFFVVLRTAKLIALKTFALYGISFLFWQLFSSSSASFLATSIHLKVEGWPGEREKERGRPMRQGQLTAAEAAAATV
jgi:hypothetical protein